MGDRSSVPQGRGSNAGTISSGYKLLIWVWGSAEFLSPFQGLRIWMLYPGFAPWAAVCRRFAAALQACEEILDALQASVQFLHRSCIGDTDMFLGSEAFRRNCRYMRITQ